MWPFRRAQAATPETTSTTIRLTFTNERSTPITVGLEPLGYFFDVPPGEGQVAEFAPNDSDQPHLEIFVEDNGIAVWEQSGDSQGLRPEGGHYGEEGPA